MPNAGPAENLVFQLGKIEALYAAKPEESRSMQRIVPSIQDRTAIFDSS